MNPPSVPRLVPPTRLLVTGHQESKSPALFVRRPDGMDEWIFIHNEGGNAYFKSPGGSFDAANGDAVLIRPRSPHEYGVDPRHGYWKNTWTHFLPRPDCIEWLQWPEFAPGMMTLHLEDPIRRQVRAEMRHMDAFAHSTGRRHEEFAVNALERALLLCDSQNPRHAGDRQDERIRKAVHLLCLQPEERLTVAALARRCGLSRSRFAELFREQAGVPPVEFLENQRLRRARELLEHTSLNVSEISEQSGFASPFYFSLRFKKHFGQSPRDYRRAKG